MKPIKDNLSSTADLTGRLPSSSRDEGASVSESFPAKSKADLLLERLKKNRAQRTEKDGNQLLEGPKDSEASGQHYDPIRRKELRKLKNQESQAAGEIAEAGQLEDVYIRRDNEEKNYDDSTLPLLDRALNQEFEPPLVTISSAQEYFQIPLLPTSRQSQSQYQPLLYFPIGSSEISQMCFTCGHVSRLCSCFFTSNSTQIDNLVVQNPFNEIDALDGSIHLNELDLPRQPDPKIEKLFALIEKNKLFNMHCMDKCITLGDKRDDGVFIGNRPLLSNILLRGESFPEEIASLFGSNPRLRLSRATLRTLRELKESLKREVVRQAYMSSPAKKPIENLSYENISLASLMTPISQGGVMMRVIEDPIVDRCLQPSLSLYPSKEFGGVIGNWDENTPSEIRLGNYNPKELQNISKRVILRVHLHQLNILDHPMMILEDRLRISIEKVYIQYRALLEEHVFSYLIYRVDALIIEVSRIVAERELRTNRNTPEDYEEEIAILKVLLKDIAESVTALAESFQTFSTLSTELYKLWKELQATRRSQGFNSTKLRLVAIRVQRYEQNSNQSAAENSTVNQNPAKKSSVLKKLFGSEEPFPLQSNQPHTSTNDEIQDDSLWILLKSKLPNVLHIFTTASEMINSSISEQTTGENQSNFVRSKSMSPRSSSILASHRLEDRDAAVKSALKDAISSLLSYASPYPDVIFRLSHDMDITNDSQVPAEELHRRQSWQYYNWFVTLSLDDRKVTTAKSCRVQPFPSYHVAFQQSIEIRAATLPRSITVNVFSKFNNSPAVLVGTIQVPTLVGHRDSFTVAHASAPVLGWFTCISESVLNRPAKTLTEWLLSKPDPATASRFVGAILCAVEYDNSSVTSALQGPVDDEVKPKDVAVIPPHATKTLGDSSFTFQNSSFSRERDFLELLPDIAYLDPNDPKNDTLLYVKQQGRKTLLDADVFQLVRSADLVWAYNEHGVYYDDFMRTQLGVRLQLLKIRSAKPFLFNEPVPMDESEIKASEVYNGILSKNAPSADLLALLPPTTVSGSLLTITEESRDYSTDLLGKAKAGDFIQRVKNSRAATDRNKRRKPISTSSVVSAVDYLPPSEEGGGLDALIPKGKRALKPTPKNRTPQSQQVGNCNLLIQIVGARNVPLREESKDDSNPVESQANNVNFTSTRNIPLRDRSIRTRDQPLQANDSQNNSNTTSNGGEEVSPLLDSSWFDTTKISERRRANTFVEIKFQEHTLSTSTCEGATPIWKQLLSLPFHPPQSDFSPSNLLQVQDDVIFTLFDEIFEDDSDKTGFLEGERTDRVEKRFLGRFVVPFGTIYKTGRVEGVFRLDSPAFIVGYSNNSRFSQSRTPQPQQIPQQQQGLLVWSSRQSYLWTLLFNCDCFGGLSSTPASIPINNPDDDLFNAGEALSKTQISTVESEFQSYLSNDRGVSYLKILITLDPLLVAPPSPSDLERYEIIPTSALPLDRPLIPYARKWLDSLKDIGRRMLSRSIKIFATNSQGQEVLVCRYLTPQRPPPGFYTRRACLHLVSRIPFLADAISFSADVDLWCSASQVWEIGAGDEEEHAVMLYNFLYYLAHYGSGEQSSSSQPAMPHSSSVGQVGSSVVMAYPTAERVAAESVFLVQGIGVPEGETVYVMIRAQPLGQVSINSFSPSQYLIINPNTGHCFSAADSTCPLKSIHTIATPYNVWANVQHSDIPSQLSFDLHKPNLWQPFFHPTRFPYPQYGLSSIQTEVLYTETKRSYCLEIETSLREAVRSNVRKWRSKRLRSSTTFHPDACTAATEILSQLEDWKIGGPTELSRQLDRSGGQSKLPDDPMEIIRHEIRAKLRPVLRNRVLHGFPMNIPYTDVDSVLAEIKALCVHETSHPEVQFVFGVRAFPIVNQLVSLWIFIGTLETTANTYVYSRRGLEA